ncbi:hypothetical protein [Sphingomonas paeninsulae]|uniref:hypothetical protein n=1 Tax=Sphingomonas paeninsulae TaxID=2319844 RepID=UPI001968DDFE|nr:hypothetical protein [Sphingomonas paeninsulae]
MLILSPVRDYTRREQAGILLIALFSFAEPPLIRLARHGSIGPSLFTGSRLPLRTIPIEHQVHTKPDVRTWFLCLRAGLI